MSKEAIILGGNSGVGRALAERLAQEGYSLVLTARDSRDLQAVCSHLNLSYGTRCAYIVADLSRVDFQAEAYLLECEQVLSHVQALFVCTGSIHPDEDGLSHLNLVDDLLAVNFTNLAKVISCTVKRFELRDSGTIVVFSSIATGRPRKRNVVYTAAKMALQSYCRSLQHTLARTSVHIQIYVLGYVDTAMSDGQKLLFPVASPQALAARVVRNLPSKVRTRYFPRYWWAIVTCLRALPWWVFKRLSF